MQKKSFPCSVPHFYSCRIKVPASSCRLACSKLSAWPSSPGGVSVGGGSRQAARCSARWGTSFSLPLLRMTQSVIKDFQLSAKNGIRSSALEGRVGDRRNGFCSRLCIHTHMCKYTHSTQSWGAACPGKVYFALGGGRILLKAFAKTGSNFQSLLPIFVSHFLGILPLVFTSLRRKLVKE